MADPVTAVAITSFGISAASQIVSANSKADAARKEAANKNLQADEVLTASKREQGLLSIKGDRAQGQALQAYGEANVDISGSSLLQLEDIARQTNSESLAMDHAARFRASQLRAGADIANSQANDTQTAGLLGGASTLLQGGASLYRQPNSGQTQKLGSL
jgi:hypothetical protein